jgi:hypothetical protein
MQLACWASGEQQSMQGRLQSGVSALTAVMTVLLLPLLLAVTHSRKQCWRSFWPRRWEQLQQQVAAVHIQALLLQQQVVGVLLILAGPAVAGMTPEVRLGCSGG